MPRYVVYLIRYVSTIRIVYRIKCIAIRIVSYHPNDTQPYFCLLRCIKPAAGVSRVAVGCCLLPVGASDVPVRPAHDVEGRAAEQLVTRQPEPHTPGTRTSHSRYQNLTLQVPEPHTPGTRTSHSGYQNLTLQVPEPHTPGTRTSHSRY